VAAWENDRADGSGVRLSFSLTRSYKDAQGAWQQSGPISLNLSDLPLVIEACRQAFVFGHAPRGEASE
jgi:hypothetical protein